MTEDCAKTPQGTKTNAAMASRKQRVMKTSPWGNSHRVRVFILPPRRLGDLEARRSPPAEQSHKRLMNLSVVVHHAVQDGVVVRSRNLGVLHRQARGPPRARIVGGLPPHLGQLRAAG